MKMNETQTKNVITLKGSVEIVTEFLDYAINSILYQRGLYPPEDFIGVEKYGLKLLVTANEKLKLYISDVMTQIQDWLSKKMVHRVILLFANPITKQNLERWDFVTKFDKENAEQKKSGEKSIKDINNEIRAVIRQITASVTFLPLLEGPCSFDILLHVNNNEDEINKDWSDAPSCNIENSQEVRLRSFSTSVQTVDTIVSYRSA